MPNTNNITRMNNAVGRRLGKSGICFAGILLSWGFFVCETMNAQAPDWLWAKGIGGTGQDVGCSIAVDLSGNVYTTGYFFGTVDFDPDSSGSFYLTSTVAGNIFISKLDSMGGFLWAKAMGGTSDDEGLSIALDDSGNVYATGYFEGTADFDPDSSLSFNLTSSGGRDIFILKLDRWGNLVWAKAIGGTGWDYSNSIALDDLGNVYTTGRFSGIVDFNPDSSGTFYLTSVWGSDAFISKLDKSGNFVWAKQLGGTGTEEGISIGLDASGNVYTTGAFDGTADFNPDSSGSFYLTSAGSNDIFISKLDSSGNFLWAKRMGGTDTELGLSLALDASGNVYTTGAFNGTVDFDPGVDTFELTSPFGTDDIFISKLDSSGNFVWAKSMGGTDWDGGLSIVLDSSANIYTTGYFWSIAGFDPGPGTYNITSTGFEDVFVSKLDSSGNFIWATAMGGIGDDYGYGIALSASGDVYLTGFFNGPSITCGSTTLINADTTNVTDIFIARLGHLITGIETVANYDGVSIFPNPATNNLNLTLTGNHKYVSITITDIAGKIIYTTSVANQQKIEVSTKDFSGGIYLLKIQTREFVETRKFIVVK